MLKTPGAFPRAAIAGMVMLLFSLAGQRAAATTFELTNSQLEWVGAQIFHNECSSREACLVHWNEGEGFPSLGIGHFIWYPQGQEERFTESFPGLLRYLTERGVALPLWLDEREPRTPPWPDRDSFLRADGVDPRVDSLRAFLARYKGEQAGYLVERARQALTDVVEASDQPEVTGKKVALLASSPGGVYSLIDYVNFKGEGTSGTERYQGEGWGLLQVLEAMTPVESPEAAVVAFRLAAAAVLQRRAELAERPIERERWLPGWLKRVDTYRQPDS